MALPLGIHGLTFDLLKSKGSGQRGQEAALGGPGWVTGHGSGFGKERSVFVGEGIVILCPARCDLGEFDVEVLGTSVPRKGATTPAGQSD